MTQPQQIKKGYVRGVRGAVITPIKPDGDDDPEAVSYGIKTAQQIGVNLVVEAGNAATLRGGDQILAYVKDPDTVVAANLTVQNARFDAAAMEVLAGGTLITETVESEEVITGWEAPSIEEQQNPPQFKLEIYAANHNKRGGLDGFVKYTFFYGCSHFGNETLQDQNWVIPEMNIECFENPSKATGGVYRKEFVPVLPAELSPAEPA